MSLNEELKTTIKEACAVEDIFTGLETLVGENFGGTLKSGVGIDDTNLPKSVCADYCAKFENIETHKNFTKEQMKEYYTLLNKERIKREGYEIGDFVHDNIEEASEDFGLDKIAFVTLTIYVDKFDGNFDVVRKDMDELFGKFKAKYEELSL